MDITTSFANNLKTIRNSKGYTQKELAGLIGKSTSLIASYESPQLYKLPDGHMLLKLATALEVGVDELVAY